MTNFIQMEAERMKPKIDSANFRGMNTAKDLDELVHHYDTWAPNYDQELGTFGHKKHLVVQEVTKITGKNRNVRILDVAAGTGICGELLKKEGFTNVDALDASQEMLNVARRKGIYKVLLCAYVKQGRPLPIEDNTYDILTIVGGLGTNHIREDCFFELSRILKPGGSIVNITPVHALGSQRSLFEREMLQNHQENVLYWIDTIHVPVYFNGVDGIMYLFQKPNMVVI